MAYAGKTAMNHASSGQRPLTKGIGARFFRMSRTSLGEEDIPEKENSISRSRGMKQHDVLKQRSIILNDQNSSGQWKEIQQRGRR